MNRRYQVFVSSTYADLKKERQKVIQTLLEMDCIPTGMELFPAVDEEQWEFIKRVINDCDYYLLIIGGRYGSTTPEGISYTEKEYDYAIEQGMKVIALLHENPEDIPVGKSDIDPELRERLKQFREKVASNRLIKYWKSTEDLPGLVALNVQKTIKMYPAVGWIRADKATNEELLNEINELRKDNIKLKRDIESYKSKEEVEITNLAGLDETITISGKYIDRVSGYSKWSTKISWHELFALLAPYLLKYPNDEYVKSVLGNVLFEKSGFNGHSATISDRDFHTIQVQFMALKLVNTEFSKTVQGAMALFWSLTNKGKVLLMELKTIHSKGT